MPRVIWRKPLPHLIAMEAAALFAQEFDSVPVWYDLPGGVFGIDGEPGRFRAQEMPECGGWEVVVMEE